MSESGRHGANGRLQLWCWFLQTKQLLLLLQKEDTSGVQQLTCLFNSGHLLHPFLQNIESKRVLKRLKTNSPLESCWHCFVLPDPSFLKLMSSPLPFWLWRLDKIHSVLEAFLWMLCSESERRTKRGNHTSRFECKQSKEKKKENLAARLVALLVVVKSLVQSSSKKRQRPAMQASSLN